MVIWLLCAETTQEISLISLNCFHQCQCRFLIQWLRIRSAGIVNMICYHDKKVSKVPVRWANSFFSFLISFCRIILLSPQSEAAFWLEQSDRAYFRKREKSRINAIRSSLLPKVSQERTILLPPPALGSIIQSAKPHCCKVACGTKIRHRWWASK